MVDPDDYWVNKPMEPMFKAMMYDRDIWMAKQDGEDRAIDIFIRATNHDGKTHYVGINCWFCNAVNEIKEGIND